MKEQTISILDYRIFTGQKEIFGNGVTGTINAMNPHSYIIARKDDLFRDALKASDYILSDGVGIQLAVLLLHGKKIKKIAGADLHQVVIESLNKRGGSCFYLGSSENTLLRIKERMAREKREVRVGSYSPAYHDKFSPEENEAMITAVNRFRPDVLFVGMTAPKQEKWVYEHRDSLNVPLICNIGAAFDFYAGTVKRPGKFWIRMGLEWLPRFIREPKRLWKRNLVSTPLFLYYLIIEKIRLIKRSGSETEEFQQSG